jgi:hypothetical protein
VGFDDWAATFGTAAMCTEWPSPSGSRAIASGPYPDVPVLVLNGDFDMRTPVAGALTIANRFKQGQLTIVPDVGHSVLGADLTGCAQSSIIGWLQGRTPPRICPPSPRLLPLMSPYRRSVATTPTAGNVGGKVGRTVGAVLSTIEDASNTWLFEQFSVSTDDPPGLLAKDGLAGGLVVSQGIPASFARSFRMIEFAVVPGVELSGTLSIFPGGLPIQFQGTFKVRGDKAARGTLTLKGSQLTGTLGGRKVVASTRYRGIIGPRGMRFPTRVAL